MSEQARDIEDKPLWWWNERELRMEPIEVGSEQDRIGCIGWRQSGQAAKRLHEYWMPDWLTPIPFASMVRALIKAA